MKKITFDGFINLLKSFGGGSDTREQTQYSYTTRITNFYNLLDDLYATSWLAAKVIDIPIEDAFREGRTIFIKDEKTRKAIEEFYIEVDDKIELAIKYARVFGGAGIIVVSEDDSLDKPLSMMKQGDLINLSVVDSSQLVPQNVEQNPLSPMYLKPYGYTVTGSSQKIHPSRVIYIDGVITTNRERQRNNSFGSSSYERIYKNIEDAAQTNSSLRNLVEQSNLDVVKMDGLNDAVASGAEEAVKERIKILSQMKSILNTIAIDGKDDYVNIAKSFSGLDAVQMNMFMIVSAGADIPFTRFMGKSADGQNATGEGDLKNYYDSVKSKVQIGRMQSIYKILDPIINLHVTGNKDTFEYEFNPLFQMTEEQMATIAKTKADTHAIYLDRNVITETAVLEELQKEGVYADFNPDKKPEFNIEGQGYKGSAADPDSSLNGAQVAAILSIIEKIRSGEITKETAKQVMITSFPISSGEADELLNEVKEGSEKKKNDA